MFDHIVRNLDDSENVDNQAFLEISAGYWLRLAMSSCNNSLGKPLAQLPSITRDLLAGEKPSLQRNKQLKRSDLQEGIDTQTISSDNSDVDVELPCEENNFGEALNATGIDTWHSNWGFEDEMSWFDILREPPLQ